MSIATGMSLTANGTDCCLASEHKTTCHFCCHIRNQMDVICLQVSSDNNRKRHSLSPEDKSYPVNAFHLFANVLLAFWLFMVAISYILLSRNINTFGGCRGKYAEKISSFDKNSSNASTENDATANDAFSCSESSGHGKKKSFNNCWSEVRTKCDACYEISDLSKASYMHSLLSLEGDSEWLSEDPSTPFSNKCETYCEISDFEQGSYLNSLISLDDEDSEWLSDSKSYVCSSENPSTPSYKGNAYFEISDLEKASYMHSLLSLEDEEDSEWLSDSKPFGGSSEDPSTPLSYKFDAASEISDFGKASYLHSLLNLEDEDSEWLSDWKHFGGSSENPLTPLSYKFDAAYEILDFDKASHLHSVLSLEDEDSEWLSNLKSVGCSFESISTPLSYKFDASYEISALDKSSYIHSLISLEDEDSDLLSDEHSKPFGCSSENPSAPQSNKCNAFYEISYLDKTSYLHSLLSFEDEISDLDKYNYLLSLLSLEDEDSDWFSDSKSSECSCDNSTLSYKCDPYYDSSDLDKASYLNSLLTLEDEDSEWLSDLDTSSSFAGVHRGNPEDNISVEHLLETACIEEFSDDEPLFWPYEGKLSWNSEEPLSSFCNSPRRRFLFDSRSVTSRIKGCNKQKGDEALSSVNHETSRLSMRGRRSEKIVPLECEEFDSTKDILGNEYFALGQELSIETLMGLKEFDGHEGLGSEFNYVFLLD